MSEHNITNLRSANQPEEDLWELDDDREKSVLAETKTIEEPLKEDPSEQSPEESTPRSDEEEIAEQEETEKDQESTTPKEKISTLEKIFLALIALGFLALAAYGYMWLYKQNHSNVQTSITYPVNGAHLSIASVKTHWTTAKKSYETKMGAHILPSAIITLDSTFNNSGALRVHFMSPKEEISGDPITLTINKGKFEKIKHPNIHISDNGIEATIISSDGFENESQFSGYKIDHSTISNLHTAKSWHLIISEGKSRNANSSQFKELLKVKILPKFQ